MSNEKQKSVVVFTRACSEIDVEVNAIFDPREDAPTSFEVSAHGVVANIVLVPYMTDDEARPLAAAIEQTLFAEAERRVLGYLTRAQGPADA